jgi:two-component system phosphate regulon sensor histidine kinase PhoR
MFLSAILMLSVIACLLFLLKIIRRQKQLAELKNDLIANITHEFKTPIATVKVALEGMENFNEENNPAKTRDYLQISREQTDKLQTMVEKLLETATIDGNQLQLKMEAFPVTQILRNLLGKYRNTAKNKVFSFEASPEDIGILADPFHMENALNNILDNAVKYGGEKIKTSVLAKNGTIEILISDNGNNLSKTEAAQVFEKFYRVPRGNIHDVKGYGIGLYYTKNIIENHGGNIRLILDGQTKFLVSLPNG